MKENITLERHFKPIIDPLKQIVEKTIESSKDPIMAEKFFSGEDEEPKPKRKSTIECFVWQFYTGFHACEINIESIENCTIHFKRNVWNTTARFIVWPRSHRWRNFRDSLMISVRYLLQISEEQEKLHANYNPFRQKYLKAVLSSKKVVNIDVVKFISATRKRCLTTNVSSCTKTTIIIDGKRYDGTPGLYELIFMKFNNENICTDVDVQIYRSILINAHRWDHSPNNQVMVSKRYKNIIAPLLLGKKNWNRNK